MKNKIIVILLFLCCACSNENEIQLTIPGISEYEMTVIGYFKTVALGFENGNASRVTRKWKTPIKIFIEGTPSEILVEKLEKTITDINALVTDSFYMEIVDTISQSNCAIFFGKGEDFLAAYPSSNYPVNTNSLARVSVKFADNIIYEGLIFIDTHRTDVTQQKSLILEEVTQSLGLGRDSSKYPDSIFYETATDGGFANEYSTRDEDIIRLLYHPNMKIGLNANQVNPILEDILANN